MENNLIKFLNIIGASVCHQLPERSYYAGTLKIPVCARCEGIYIGFFITAIILFLMFRKRESDMAPLYVVVIMILFLFSTAINGGLSYFFNIYTNNILRFSTGYLAGSAAMTIIYPVFNYQYFKEPAAVKVFSKPLHFIVFLLFGTGFMLAGISNINAINHFLIYFSAFSIIFTFYFVNIILIMLIPAFSRKALKLFSKHLLLPSAIALLLTAIELFISYRFHLYVVTLG